MEVPGFQLGPIDLEVGEGQYFVLLGPNGSGKTSLLEWAAGFRRARSGRLHVGGEDVSDARPAGRRLSVVFQQSALFPHLSVRDNIAFPLRMARWAPDRIAARIAELAELLHVGERLDAPAGRISGGEARRTALARALALPRPVLLLDEPLSAVDPALHRDLRGELSRLQRQLGLTVVHVTHSILEARSLGTHLGVLVAGNVEQVGRIDEVFDRPANRRVARALAVSNFVEDASRDEGPQLDVGPGLPLSSATGRGRRARVFDLSLSESPSAYTRAGEIVGRQVDGHGQEVVWVRLDASDVEVEVPSPNHGNHREGSRAHVSFERARAERY